MWSFCQPPCIKYGFGNFLSYRSLALTSKEFAYYGHWLFVIPRVLQPAFILCWLAGVFCQPVQCAYAKMTSFVGKRETSNMETRDHLLCFYQLQTIGVMVSFIIINIKIIITVMKFLNSFPISTIGINTHMRAHTNE